MPFRPSRWVVYAPVALLPFLAAVALDGRSLQNGLSERVLQNLHKAGATWASPTVDGRDVVLSGDAPDAAQIEAAIAAAAGTWGIRRVESIARVAPAPAKPLSFMLHDERVPAQFAERS